MVRLLTLSGLILLLAAPTASAGVREKILRECQDGRITGHYTPKQLRDARKHIPTDVDEYSDCRDVLAQRHARPAAAEARAAAGASKRAGRRAAQHRPRAPDRQRPGRDARRSTTRASRARPSRSASRA